MPMSEDKEELSDLTTVKEGRNDKIKVKLVGKTKRQTFNQSRSKIVVDWEEKKGIRGKSQLGE